MNALVGLSLYPHVITRHYDVMRWGIPTLNYQQIKNPHNRIQKLKTPDIFQKCFYTMWGA